VFYFLFEECLKILKPFLVYDWLLMTLEHFSDQIFRYSIRNYEFVNLMDKIWHYVSLHIFKGFFSQVVFFFEIRFIFLVLLIICYIFRYLFSQFFGGIPILLTFDESMLLEQRGAKLSVFEQFSNNYLSCF
jgi:hypothetical protein